MEDLFYLGTIVPVPYNFIPSGAVECNGQLLSIPQNNALFALIGNTYGGSYPNTFAVPNLQGFEPHPGITYVICTQGYFPTRS